MSKEKKIPEPYQSLFQKYKDETGGNPVYEPEETRFTGYFKRWMSGNLSQFKTFLSILLEFDRETRGVPALHPAGPYGLSPYFLKWLEDKMGFSDGIPAKCAECKDGIETPRFVKTYCGLLSPICEGDDYRKAREAE